jgi:hypothetical protein
MIELRDDELVFSFPEVHAEARFSVSFQRTLRVPDDGREYPLPAGLGEFPLRHVDDYADTVPAAWLQRGGVLLPMHAAEAMWLNFGGRYPAALKVAAGKINAVDGAKWSTGLHGPARVQADDAWPGRGRNPEQDYLALPDQPWMDGFNVADGQVRQFVAMPLGGGHTAEEQLTGRADVGGLQLLAYPLRAELYRQPWQDEWARLSPVCACALESEAMGLGLGGRIRQDIEGDTWGTESYDTDHPARCFVHLVNAAQWEAITGEPMPTPAITKAQYQQYGIPWFDYSAGGAKVPGSQVLADLRSIEEMTALPDSGGIPFDRVRVIRPRRRSAAVRQGLEAEWA